MNERETERKPRKMRNGLMRKMRIVHAFWVFVRNKLWDDILLLLQNGRLFLGLAMVLVGLLSFASDRFCDGGTSSYYTCTRPATYYFYPAWAILIVLVGAFFIVLWFLRKQT